MLLTLMSRMLVQVAHAISRTRNSNLKRFFLRVQAKSGTKKAAVALARKVLCILHHLLINREMYEENGYMKSKPVKFDRYQKNGCQGVHIAPTFLGLPMFFIGKYKRDLHPQTLTMYLYISATQDISV